MSRDRKICLLLLATVFALSCFLAEKYLHPVPIRTLQTNQPGTLLHFSPDGRWLVTSSTIFSPDLPRTIELWDVNNASRVAKYDDVGISSAGFLDDSSRWMGIKKKRGLAEVIILDLVNNKEYRIDKLSYRTGLLPDSSGVANEDGYLVSNLSQLDPSGTRLLRFPAERGGDATIIEVSNRDNVVVLEASNRVNFSNLKFTNDGSQVVGVPEWGPEQLEIWDAKTGKRQSPIPLPFKLGSIQDLCWRGDGTLCVTKQDVARGSVRYLLNLKSGSFRQMAFVKHSLVDRSSENYLVVRPTKEKAIVGGVDEIWETIVGAVTPQGDKPIYTHAGKAAPQISAWIAENNESVMAAWCADDREEWLSKLAFEYPTLQRFVSKKSYVDIKSWCFLSGSWQSNDEMHLDMPPEIAPGAVRFGKQNGKILIGAISRKNPSAVDIYNFPAAIPLQNRIVAALWITAGAFVGMLGFFLFQRLFPRKNKPLPDAVETPADDEPILIQMIDNEMPK